MKFVHLLSALLLVSLVSCQNTPNTKNEESNSLPDKEVESGKPSHNAIPEVGTLTGDTLNISGNLVLFFGPADSTGKGLSEEIKSYQSLATKMMDSISAKSDIKALYATAGFFRIYTSKGTAMVISKNALKSETGVLMTDGSQPPTIRKGVFTESEYHNFIKSYFLSTTAVNSN